MGKDPELSLCCTGPPHGGNHLVRFNNFDPDRPELCSSRQELALTTPRLPRRQRKLLHLSRFCARDWFGAGRQDINDQRNQVPVRSASLTLREG